MAGLRTECAVLTSWTSSLTMQILSTLQAAHKRLHASGGRLTKASADRWGDAPLFFANAQDLPASSEVPDELQCS